MQARTRKLHICMQSLDKSLHATAAPEAYTASTPALYSPPSRGAAELCDAVAVASAKRLSHIP